MILDRSLTAAVRGRSIRKIAPRVGLIILHNAVVETMMYWTEEADLLNEFENGEDTVKKYLQLLRNGWKT